MTHAMIAIMSGFIGFGIGLLAGILIIGSVEEAERQRKEDNK